MHTHIDGHIVCGKSGRTVDSPPHATPELGYRMPWTCHRYRRSRRGSTGVFVLGDLDESIGRCQRHDDSVAVTFKRIT